MKKALVSGYIGFNNFGDEAIFYALEQHLKSLGYTVSVLSNNKNETKNKYQVGVYNFKKPFQILKAILNCDVLISGGGSLLQNKTSNASLIYYLLIILFAKICFKKVMIFAQGFEPIKGALYQFITKIILKTVDYITVRDEKSKELLSKWNIKSDLVSDPAYSLVQNELINQNKDGLIIQLRKYKNITEDFIATLAKLISEKYKADINVFSFQKEFDEKICLKFIDKLKKYNVEAKYISDKSIDETIEIINNSKYIISTRLHGLIIACALKTKAFALIYDDKIKTLTDELNIDNIDLSDCNYEELDKKLDCYFNENNKKDYAYRQFHWDCIDSFLENERTM